MYFENIRIDQGVFENVQGYFIKILDAMRFCVADRRSAAHLPCSSSFCLARHLASSERRETPAEEGLPLSEGYGGERAAVDGIRGSGADEIRGVTAADGGKRRQSLRPRRSGEGKRAAGRWIGVGAEASHLRWDSKRTPVIRFR